jgi:hypothetical protein
MSNIVVAENRIPAMSEAAIDRVRVLEAEVLKLPQLQLTTHHVLHGGMYARTVTLPAGSVITGVFIRVPTMLVVNGHAVVNTSNEGMTLVGHNVLAASAHRRQAFMAIEETHLTMVFATQAQTVEQAEDEFTNEAHLLISRHADAINHITITGE